MVLSNAERQARHRKRVRERADTGVTPEDVQRVSKKYMTNIRFIVLGDPAAINRQMFLVQN